MSRLIHLCVYVYVGIHACVLDTELMLYIWLSLYSFDKQSTRTEQAVISNVILKEEPVTCHLELQMWPFVFSFLYRKIHGREGKGKKWKKEIRREKRKEERNKKGKLQKRENI